MSFDYERFLGAARRLSADGAGVEDLLRFFRENGASPIDSIKMLRAIKGLPLAQAKHTFHFSEAWQDMRPEHDEFHERLEGAAAEAIAILESRSREKVE